MRWWSICSPGTLESVTDLTLFGGANALAVEARRHLGDRGRAQPN